MAKRSTTIHPTEKRFKAYWGDGYSKRGSKIVGLDFFSYNNGYSVVHISEIIKLPLNSILLVGGWSEKLRGKRNVIVSKKGSQEYHTIKRIK